MRVLIAFPDDQQTNKALVDACTERGDTVYSIDARREPTSMYNFIAKHHGAFDLVLMGREIDLYPDFVRAKDRYPDIKFAIWNVDVRKNLEEWGFLVNFVEEVDYYFTVAMGVVDRWTQVNPNTYYVPQGIQGEKYHECVPTDDQIKKYRCDVSFIGNCIDEIHRERRYILETLRTSHYDFKHLTGVYDEEHNAAVSCARISLGCTHSPEVSYYTSVRTWKVIAAQGVVLEQWHDGLDEMFGGKIALYRDPSDCVDKVGEILSNYDKYKENAFKLHEWAMASQRYVHRIHQIAGIIGKE